jgi:hypothetical protein
VQKIEKRSVFPHLHKLLQLSALVCVALFLDFSAALTQSSQAPPIIITHVTVINPGSSSVQRDMTVIINGDRIISVSHWFIPPG